MSCFVCFRVSDYYAGQAVKLALVVGYIGSIGFRIRLVCCWVRWLGALVAWRLVACWSGGLGGLVVGGSFGGLLAWWPGG